VPDITVFAPATVANVGPGFDVLGCAVSGMGDWVTARLIEMPGVHIEAVEGDAGRLPREATRNTAGIAALETLRLLEVRNAGVALRLRKGLPLGSGLGSSGASAAAATWATNLLFGAPLSKHDLLPAGLAAEATVSGWHADNVGPSLLGGFILIRSYDPLELIELPSPHSIVFVLVHPDFELPTRKAREVVPNTISLAQHVANSGNLAALMAALFGGNVRLLGKATSDVIVEPARAPLIPGFAAVKAAALAAGAYGCSISGAGPTVFAITDDIQSAPMISAAMIDAFGQAGLIASSVISHVDMDGARAVAPPA